MAFEFVLIGLVTVTIVSFSRRTQTKLKDLEKQVQTLQESLDRMTPKASGAQPSDAKP